MEFYRPTKKPVNVPIVALIDILVCLLFFLIVTQSKMDTKVPRSEMKVTLPTANSMKVNTVTVARTVLSLDPEGNAEIDGLNVIDGFLKETLIANRGQRPGLKLVLRADRDCPWGKILEAHSAAVQAGYGKDEVIYRVTKSAETENSAPDSTQ
ncbi:MAG: ExbD/TolR family protein [Akkermansiaceae bacterium]